MRRAAVALAAILCSTGAGGCYTYTSVTPADLSADTRIRARLAPMEAARLEELVGGESRYVEGTVLEATPDSVLVLMDVFAELRGDRIRNLQQRVQVARAGIIDSEIREMDAVRTGIVVGAVAAAIGVAVASFSGEQSGGGEGPEPPGELRWSWLRIPIRLGGG